MSDITIVKFVYVPLQHDDQELWTVLERCHLKNAVTDLGKHCRADMCDMR